MSSDFGPLEWYCLNPTLIIGIRHSARSSPAITVASYHYEHLSIASITSPFFSDALHSSGSRFVPKGAIFSESMGTLISLTEISCRNLMRIVASLPLFGSLKHSITLPMDHMLNLNDSSILKASSSVSTVRFWRQLISSGEKFEKLVIAKALPASPPNSCWKWN